MGESRLNNLIVIAVEKEEVGGVDLYKAIYKFANIKTRRYLLK